MVSEGFTELFRHVATAYGQHGPELHLTLPGQRPVRLLPVAPYRWRVPGLAGTEIAFDAPDSIRISQVDPLRKTALVTAAAVRTALAIASSGLSPHWSVRV